MGEDNETTEGISRDDVEQAMTFLGMFNPKPEIPLEVTLTGHELVAVGRKLQRLEATLSEWSREMEVIRETLDRLDGLA